jgi:hypothetical protein
MMLPDVDSSLSMGDPALAPLDDLSGRDSPLFDYANLPNRTLFHCSPDSGLLDFLESNLFPNSLFSVLPPM